MIKYVDRLAKKMGRGYFSKPKDKSRLNDEVNDLSIYDKHLTAKPRKLTASEEIDIVHKVLVEFKLVKEVAKEHNVRASKVNSLVQKARKKPKFIKEILQERDNKEQRSELIK